MTGVEVPDYSWLWDFAFLTMSIVAALAYAAMRAKDKMESRLKIMQHKPRISKRLASWGLRPRLKEDSDLCGFSKPGEWLCRCGKTNCTTFGKLCESVGATNATPPVQPLPNRKAAIARTKAKS